MTNFEYYKEGISFIADTHGSTFGFSGDNGKLFPCSPFNCHLCVFNNSEPHTCVGAKTKWLYEEHVEKPKLTRKERLLCEILEHGYIARDENGVLAWYPTMPGKRKHDWGPLNYGFAIPSKLGKFPFISWEKGIFWSVMDLLKLEVEE